MLDLWPLESDSFVYRARLDRVVDGDTIDLICDLGFRTYEKIRTRLWRVDTAEIWGVKQESDEYAQGSQHSQWVKMWFFNREGPEWPFLVSTHEDVGAYCRWPALIRTRSGEDRLREDLVEAFPEVDTLETDQQ